MFRKNLRKKSFTRKKTTRKKNNKLEEDNHWIKISMYSKKKKSIII